MSNKIMLGDFIYRLRKDKNLSQAELGELVGVSNKAVSKWETFEANPDLNIIKKLAEVLGVTTDELLDCKKCEINDSSTQNEKSESCENCSSYISCDKNFIGIKGLTTKTDSYYEFVSERKTKKGTPYVHINWGKDKNGKIRRAKGILSIGIISSGIFSVGLISIGIFCLGLISIGILALGLIGIGVVSASAISVGLGVAVGGIAVGCIAVGGIAVGILSVGGISVGVYAYTGIYGKAIGIYTFYTKTRFF